MAHSHNFLSKVTEKVDLDRIDLSKNLTLMRATVDVRMLCLWNLEKKNV